jgi:hypothetical protein
MVVVRAGDKSVATGEPMHQALLHQELERAVDGDRRDAALGSGELVGDVVGAERAVGRIKRFEHAAPDRRQPHAGPAAGRLGAGEPVARPRRLMRGVGAGVSVMIGRRVQECLPRAMLPAGVP